MNVRAGLGALGLLILGLVAARPARAEAPRVFVLPVRSNAWLDHDDRLLEARVAMALTRDRRVRPVGQRDLSPAARRQLPADLGECTVPGCLRLLGQATAAARVLALELYDEGDAPVLLATLFDARTGEAVERQELPRAPARAPSRAWADEVARWVATTSAGIRPPPPAPLPPRPTAVLMSLTLDPEQLARPEGQALLAGLRERLTRRRRPPLAPGPDAPVTHRAVVSVESFGLSERPHHLHRYRSGTLAAHLTITETRTGTVVLSRRASAQVTARARHTTDQQALDVLVSEVVWRLMSEVDDPSFDETLARGL
jgi:hypothetical protein